MQQLAAALLSRCACCAGGILQGAALRKVVVAAAGPWLSNAAERRAMEAGAPCLVHMSMMAVAQTHP